MSAQRPAKVTTFERGQAALELAVVLPLILLFLIGIVTFGRLIYTHLAVMTAANDCATVAAQATDPYDGVAQGTAAREQSLSAFSVSQQVTTAGLVAAASQSSRGVSTPSNYTCQVGYPLRSQFATLFPGVALPARFFTLKYEFTLEAQPYKSNWKATP